MTEKMDNGSEAISQEDIYFINDCRSSPDVTEADIAEFKKKIHPSFGTLENFEKLSIAEKSKIIVLSKLPSEDLKRLFGIYRQYYLPARKTMAFFHDLGETIFNLYLMTKDKKYDTKNY